MTGYRTVLVSWSEQLSLSAIGDSILGSKVPSHFVHNVTVLSDTRPTMARRDVMSFMQYSAEKDGKGLGTLHEQAVLPRHLVLSST